jgi:hypothetical protein
MVTPSVDPPKRSLWRGMAKDVFVGLLQAVGILPLKHDDAYPGMYIAIDRFGRKEIRVPVRSLHDVPRWFWS